MRIHRDQKGVIRAKPTSYRHHVTRHGDAGNVIGLRGRQVSRESRRDIDLSGRDERKTDGRVCGVKSAAISRSADFTRDLRTRTAGALLIW